MDPFLAEITLFGGNFAPRGWAFCDGQLLPIASNSALFSLLGTTYGGDGRTTFALPDLRGRAPIGPRHGPGLSSYRLGQKGGVEYVILNQTQIPSHTHTINHTLQVRADAGSGATTDDPTNAFIANDGNNQFNPVADANMGPLAGTISAFNTGGNLSHENRQPFLALNYIIALQGVFPSRS